MSLLRWFVFASVFFIASRTQDQGKCKWNQLDLSSLNSLDTPIQCSFEYGYSTYLIQYQPCSNSLSCMLDGPFMVIQSNANTNICVVNLASWDDTVTPEDTSAHDVKQYSLHYSNGKVSGSCFNPREIVVNFKCDADAKPYNSQTVVCGETSQCNYFMDVYSHLACKKPSSGSASADDGLSTGSIMLLVGFLMFFMYCVIGCVCKGRVNENGFQDVKGNTPHLDFWIRLPTLTKAGMIVTYEWTKEKYSGMRGNSSGGGETYNEENLLDDE